MEPAAVYWSAFISFITFGYKEKTIAADMKSNTGSRYRGNYISQYKGDNIR